MANPSADFPAAIHSSVDISAFATGYLGGTSPTHTQVHGKIDNEVVAIQTKLGIGDSAASSASNGAFLRKGATNTTWETIDTDDVSEGSTNLYSQWEVNTYNSVDFLQSKVTTRGLLVGADLHSSLLNVFPTASAFFNGDIAGTNLGINYFGNFAYGSSFIPLGGAYIGAFAGGSPSAPTAASAGAFLAVYGAATYDGSSWATSNGSDHIIPGLYFNAATTPTGGTVNMDIWLGSILARMIGFETDTNNINFNEAQLDSNISFYYDSGLSFSLDGGTGLGLFSLGFSSTGHAAIGSGATIDSVGVLTPLAGQTLSAAAVHMETMTNQALNVNAAVFNALIANPASTAGGTWIGQDGFVEVPSSNSQNFDSNSLLAGDGGAFYHFGSGTITQANGAVAIASNSGSGTITNSIGFRSVHLNLATSTSTNAYGLSTQLIHLSGTPTTTNYHGLHVYAPVIIGGTLTSAYGIYVEPITAGGTDRVGARIDAPSSGASTSTMTLWLSANADNTVERGGIVFGSSKDTNLYRSAADTLKTDDSFTVGKRLITTQGADVASANNLALGTDGNVFEITGTTQINLISNVGWQNGCQVTLLFTSTPTVKHNQSTSSTNITIQLAGAADFSATAGDTLTLVLSEIGGTQAWREVSRAVI